MVQNWVRPIKNGVIGNRHIFQQQNVDQFGQFGKVHCADLFQQIWQQIHTGAYH